MKYITTLVRLLLLEVSIIQTGFLTPNFPWMVQVSFRNWPTDFYVPQLTYGRTSTHAKTPTEGLEKCLGMTISTLVSNGEQYRRAFMEYYKQETGRDWLREKTVTPPTSSSALPR